MLGLIESLVAISAIILTCRFAGRIPAMMVSAFAAASAAIIMPPFASWEVESTTDVLTVRFQTIIGLVVAYKWPAKKGENFPSHLRRGRPRHSPRRTRPISAESGSFYPIPDLMGKVPIEVGGELHDLSRVSQDKLGQILFDVMQLVVSDSR